MKKLIILFIITAGFSTTANAVLFDRGSPSDLWFLILIMGVALIMIWKPILTRGIKNITSDRRSASRDRRKSVDRRSAIADRRHAA